MQRMKTRQTHEAMSLMKADHAAVKKLFDRFEKAGSGPEATQIAKEACSELKVHAAVEERIFYPALRREMDDKEGLIDEADEEHHEAKVLIAELDLMSGGEANYRAKFTVLCENVRHHIKEEEESIFPKARRTALDFDALGEQMHELKQRLTAEGVEPDEEALMVGRSGVAQLSPSRLAEKTAAPPLREKKRTRSH